MFEKVRGKKKKYDMYVYDLHGTRWLLLQRLSFLQS